MRGTLRTHEPLNQNKMNNSQEKRRTAKIDYKMLGFVVVSLLVSILVWGFIFVVITD